MTNPDPDEPIDSDLNRRSFLAAASAGAFTSLIPSIRGWDLEGGDRRDDRSAFEPTRHGFGFRNWRIRDDTDPDSDEGDPEHEFIDQWHEPFERAFDSSITSIPGRLQEALADHAREGLLEATRTNGYCYGMVFAAQQYFERPETIPRGFANASVIEHPEAPLAVPETPVLDTIVDYHTAQYLNFYAWFGRYALSNPDWIDYEEQLHGLTTALDTHGTAGITLTSSASVRSHQVLAYDYNRRSDGLSLTVYDPNRPAAAYHDWTPTIEIDTTGSEPTVAPIALGSGYDHFIHNEYDQRIRDSHGDQPSPFSTTPNVLDRLLGRALFIDIDGPVRTAILDPAGKRVERTYGDRALHYRYGADIGTYRLRVTGENDGEYTVDAYVGGHRGDLLEDIVGTSIAAGETHRYELSIGFGGGLRRR